MHIDIRYMICKYFVDHIFILIFAHSLMVSSFVNKQDMWVEIELFYHLTVCIQITDPNWIVSNT